MEDRNRGKKVKKKYEGFVRHFDIGSKKSRKKQQVEEQELQKSEKKIKQLKIETANEQKKKLK